VDTRRGAQKAHVLRLFASLVRTKRSLWWLMVKDECVMRAARPSLGADTDTARRRRQS
jgi:hypothetical protein